jgi:chaperone required for assembly of F1-ATPase
MFLKRPAFSVCAEDKGFAVCRNGKALETPLHFPIVVPTNACAEAIAKEFEGSSKKIDMRKMPLMQLALTAIDILSMRREEVISGVMRYGETELICQRATNPADLVMEQDRVWQPYIDWCKERFAADLCTGGGVIPFKQNEPALSALRTFIGTLDAFFLAGLSETCSTLGSLVLGLALMEGRAEVAAVFNAAELDLIWQSKKWGDDPVSQNRHAEIKRDLELYARWFALLGK